MKIIFAAAAEWQWMCDTTNYNYRKKKNWLNWWGIRKLSAEEENCEREKNILIWRLLDTESHLEFVIEEKISLPNP